jgi:hypothetical protein
MLEKTIRVVSENLARSVNRRVFLRRAGESAFAGMAALAAGRTEAVFASGSGKPSQTPLPTPSCAPPGPYCNTGGGILTGCQGSSCFQHLYQGQTLQCRVYYSYYQTGCWTSAVTGGYWTCCDCACGTPRATTCGCAQFSGSPAPRPDTPSRA